MSVKNSIGERFGRLVIVGMATKSKHGHTRWLCRCECGKTIEAFQYNLRSGASKSCGCVRPGPVTHGHTKGGKVSRAYNSWASMINRCGTPSNKYFCNYGARGIKVCDRWRESFAAFLEDMGEPGDDMTIERVDNNGNYEKDNCRWATRKEQNRNKRNNRMLTYQGRTQCVADWAEELALRPRTIWSRLRIGWTVDRALSTPT